MQKKLAMELEMQFGGRGESLKMWLELTHEKARKGLSSSLGRHSADAPLRH